MVLLAESGNGKSTMARKLIKMLGEKYPSVRTSQLELRVSKLDRNVFLEIGIFYRFERKERRTITS